jgi:L-lactate dehydrogenase complex protein LldF
VAETGGVILVTNEGNADLTAALPGTHIVVTGIEKVVPTLEEAGILLRLLARSAIGEPLSTYTTLIHGPRRAAEGTKRGQFHVVLVDNGRSELLGSPAREILRCIRCAACLNHCPVYTAVGGHAYGSVYSGPVGAVLTPGIVGVTSAAHLPAASTFCGRCESVCPVAIPIPKLLRFWREQSFAAGLSGERRALGLWRLAADRPWLYRLALAIAARLLRAFSVPGVGDERWLRRLPWPLEGWSCVRDLPAPEGETFQARWRRERATTS